MGGLGCQSIKNRVVVFEEDGGLLDKWIQRAQDDAAEWYSTAWLARSVQMPVGRAGQGRAGHWAAASLGSDCAVLAVGVGRREWKGGSTWSANRGILRIRPVLGMGGARCVKVEGQREKISVAADDRQQGREQTKRCPRCERDQGGGFPFEDFFKSSCM